jgi:hypothetical protein
MKKLNLLFASLLFVFVLANPLQAQFTDWVLHQASGGVIAEPSWISFTVADVSEGQADVPIQASFLIIHFSGSSPFYLYWGVACGKEQDREVSLSQLVVNLRLLDEESLFLPLVRVVSDIDRDSVSVIGQWMLENEMLVLNLPANEILKLLFETQHYITLEYPAGGVTHRVTFEVDSSLLRTFQEVCS